MLKRTSYALLAVAPLVLLAGCGSNDDPAGDSAASPSSQACDFQADPTGSAGKKVSLPPATPDLSGEVAATMHTSVGDLGVTLDASAAPCTVDSFVSLAKQGFYDGSHCHRMADTDGFRFLQCGDPLGTGMGGPGYTIPDEVKGDETYPAGTLAMARTQAPHSGGSQFFMVFGDTNLTPDYTVFGHLDAAAVKTLQKVAAKGVSQPGGDGSGEPKQPVTFTSVTVG